LNRRREAGFTLIEVVVAFTMLALIFAVGLEIFSSGMSRGVDLGQYSQALGIAQSKLAAAGVEELPKEGEVRGQSDDGRFRWSTTIARSEEGQDPAKPSQGPYVLYRVEARVDWHTDAGREQSLTLATLLLGGRQ
jgi:general secretion pathway protein I